MAKVKSTSGSGVSREIQAFETEAVTARNNDKRDSYLRDGNAVRLFSAGKLPNATQLHLLAVSPD